MVSKKQSRRNGRVAKGAPQAFMVNALHEVWLAGLGAVVKAQRGTPKLLEELIAEGARFQEERQGAAEETFRRLVGDAQARLKGGVGQVRGQAGEALENLQKIFETRVQRALTQLGVPSAQELAVLGKRVNALSQNVDKLARRTTRTRAHSTRTRAHSAIRRSTRARTAAPSAQPVP
jgi:poly(hydroxyalkanoate) granule-associated protein